VAVKKTDSGVAYYRGTVMKVHYGDEEDNDEDKEGDEDEDDESEDEDKEDDKEYANKEDDGKENKKKKGVRVSDIRFIDLELPSGEILANVPISYTSLSEVGFMIRTTSTNASTYFEHLHKSLVKENDKILTNRSLIHSFKERIEVLRKSIRSSSETKALDQSTTATLIELAAGRPSGSQCSICICPIGESNTTEEGEEPLPAIAMLSCGHFLCRECLDNYISKRGGQAIICPECRAPFDRIQDVKLISVDIRVDEMDVEDEDERELIEEYKEIAKSFSGEGPARFQWTPSMTDKLMALAEPPKAASISFEHIEPYPAIDGKKCLQFLRAASGISRLPGQKRSTVEPAILERIADGKPGSKTRRLLADLEETKGDFVVIFTQSQEYISHLSWVFEQTGIR
jgi:hypothetical protein